jgi:hypothetical protein
MIPIPFRRCLFCGEQATFVDPGGPHYVCDDELCNQALAIHNLTLERVALTPSAREALEKHRRHGRPLH